MRMHVVYRNPKQTKKSSKIIGKKAESLTEGLHTFRIKTLKSR